jgi:alpha-1,2-rhamnosyltransferase
VILDRGQLIAVDAGPVFADKLRTAMHAETARVDFRTRARKLVHKIWRVLLQGLSRMLPFASAQRFLFAPPDRIGFAWCLLLPLRVAHRRLWPQSPTPPLASPALDQFARFDESVLVLLDSSWTIPIWPAVERFKRSGGQVVGVIYDLIPLTHSHTSMPNLTDAFRSWLREHFRHSDAFVGISRFTAREVEEISKKMAVQQDSEHPLPKIDYFHLGSDLDFIGDGDDVRSEIKEIFGVKRHVFLMVGTFEPRKKHDYALDAFDRFWVNGGVATLLMIGRQAWKTESFLERVANHPQRGRQLFIIRHATDSDLDYSYRNASALIIPSEIEGFGLPIIEAFQRGLPVLCSDIPVFREIAETRATFFDLSDCGQLTAVLLEFCGSHDAQQRGVRIPQSWIGWHESTEQLCSAIVRTLGREPNDTGSSRGNVTP